MEPLWLRLLPEEGPFACTCEPLFSPLAPRAAMVSAARLHWIIQELANGRQGVVKLCSHSDKLIMQICLFPVWEPTMRNSLVISLLHMVQLDIDNAIIVDHGHKNSKGESHIRFVVKPLPVLFEGSSGSPPAMRSAVAEGSERQKHAESIGPVLAHEKGESSSEQLPVEGGATGSGSVAMESEPCAKAETDIDVVKPQRYGKATVPQQHSEKHTFAPGMPARLVGLKARPLLNGREGTLSFYDGAADRWAFKTGAEAIRVKASCLEPIGSRTKKSLGMAFQTAAFEYQHLDPVANDQVFQLLYDHAAREGQPGVAAFFLPLFSDKTAFDKMYCHMAARSPEIVYQ